MNNICNDCKHQVYCDTKKEIDKFIEDMKNNYSLKVEITALITCNAKEI